jgi:hypothetical protein
MNSGASTFKLSESCDPVVTVKHLVDAGLTPREIRRRYPWATEYSGFGGACWLREDLAAPLEPKGATE